MRVHRAGGNKGRALRILVEIAAWHTWLKLPAGMRRKVEAEVAQRASTKKVACAISNKIL